MADEYLSGNVREKLVLARKSAELYPEDYTVNVEALERVQPKDLTASEIAVRLGATWLPTEIVEQFMFEFLGTRGTHSGTSRFISLPAPASGILRASPMTAAM